MTPYEMYMKSLSSPAGPMGQTGEVYGQRDAVMRKGMRSPAAMGAMPFGLAPTPGVIGDGTPKAAPGGSGRGGVNLSGEAIDYLWGGGGNSDAAIMGPRMSFEDRAQRLIDSGRFQGGQSRDAVMGRQGGAGAPAGGPMDLGGMAADSQKPKRGLAALAGLAQSAMRSPQLNMAAPVNGGHFAGTGAGGLFNKGGMKFFG